MRLMYDSTNAADVPAGGELYAGYVDGDYQTAAQLVKRFPHATVITITVDGTHTAADVIDRETGDVEPDAAATWAVTKVAAGAFPVIYVNRSSWPAVKAAIANAQLRRRDVGYWIADWTGQPHNLRGALAVQYADPATSGGHYDTSAVYGLWPGIDPKALSKLRRAALRRITRSFSTRRFGLTRADTLLVDQLITDAKRIRGL